MHAWKTLQSPYRLLSDSTKCLALHFTSVFCACALSRIELRTEYDGMPKKKRKLSALLENDTCKETPKSSKRRQKHNISGDKLQESARAEQDTRTEGETAGMTKDRHFTVSVAVPGSILDNAQSDELRTYLAGQVARSMVIFKVDEVIIFRDGTAPELGVKKKRDSTAQMAKILQYLETPQYLRKLLYPMHHDLQFAGLLNPLDTPHHMRVDEETTFREGIVLDRPVKQGKGSLVNCGTRKSVRIDRHLLPGTRVTVKLIGESKKCLKGQVVSPSAPRMELGLYWGYTVRVAESLGDVFTGSPFQDGYDLTIGTSDHGINIDELQLRAFNHLLIVFGGVQGLEAALEADERLPVSDVNLLFDYYVNTCPGQGSRTIRTEEALLISLSAFRSQIIKQCAIVA